MEWNTNGWVCLFKKTQKYFLLTSTLSIFSIYPLAAQTSVVSSSKPPTNLVVASRGVPDSFADLAEKLLPTVVNISTSEVVKPGESIGEEDDDEGSEETPNIPPGSPFEKFFHDYMNRKQGEDNKPRRLQALGSGFIVDPSGIIVTNYHVIKNADQITVTLQDNTVLKAQMIGMDERTDLALLKVKASSPLLATHFGDSDKERVGDWVLAIGNPYGLSGTVTSGIISSRGRNIDQGPYDDFIQTDAPINRGNSGGPLFNMQGEVIGINTAIFSPSGGSIGIGFAIPSNEAKNVIDQLRQNKKVSRGWLGLRIQEVTEDIADSLNIKSSQGALVAGIEENGPAAKTELKVGDVIETLNGVIVKANALPRIVAQMPVGKKVMLEVWREGKIVKIPITIGKLPEENNISRASRKTSASKTGSIMIKDLDLSVSNITDILRQKYNLGEKQQGVVIVSIVQSGIAEGRDLKIGDVIVSIQQKKINSVYDLQHALQQAKQEQRRSVLLLIQNEEGIYWVPVSLKKLKSK